MAGPSWLVSRSVKVVPGSLSPSYLIRWWHVDHDDHQKGDHCEQSADQLMRMKTTPCSSDQTAACHLFAQCRRSCTQRPYPVWVWVWLIIFNIWPESDTLPHWILFPKKSSVYTINMNEKLTMFKLKLKDNLFSSHILRIDFSRL